jgi:hypothetical protein
MISEEYKNKIIDFLQTNIDIYVYKNGRQIYLKRGVLINTSIKLPFIFFTIKHFNKIKECHFPYPFSVKISNNIIEFNYTLSELVNNDEYLLDLFNNSEYSGDSKLYNNILYIKSNYHYESS